MLRKVYPGKQVECNHSSRHKIDHKTKGVNDDKRETQEEGNTAQDNRQTENETQECDFKIHEDNRNDEEHEQIKEDTGIEKEENREPENNKEEEIVKNEEITMLELQSEDNEKKLEVVGKVNNNQKKATKEQTENKNKIVNKDDNIENTKSEGEAKGEDEQYGKPNQQCQKHEKVIADQTKTKQQEKENQGVKTSAREEEKNNKNTIKTNELETRHFKLHQETLKSSQKNKQKEITLEKNVERERNIGETKFQKITEDGEKEIYMGCNKYVETGAQCRRSYRWYHYKCEGTTEKEIKKLYPQETH